MTDKEEATASAAAPITTVAEAVAAIRAHKPFADYIAHQQIPRWTQGDVGKVFIDTQEGDESVFIVARVDEDGEANAFNLDAKGRISDFTIARRAERFIEAQDGDILPTPITRDSDKDSACGCPKCSGEAEEPRLISGPEAIEQIRQSREFIEAKAKAAATPWTADDVDHVFTRIDTDEIFIVAGVYDGGVAEVVTLRRDGDVNAHKSSGRRADYHRLENPEEFKLLVKGGGGSRVLGPISISGSTSSGSFSGLIGALLGRKAG